MVYIGDLVAVADHLAFQSMGFSAGPVINDPVPDFPGQVQSSSVFFQSLHYPEALSYVRKSKRADPVQDLFSCVYERGMSQVMSQGNGLYQIYIKIQSLCNGPGDLR